MKLTELQEKLGERMSRVCDSDLSNEELSREIERSKAAASLGKEMVRNAETIIRARRAVGSLSTELVNSIV